MASPLLPSTTHALTHRLATSQVDGRLPSITGCIGRDGHALWTHAIESSTDTQYRIGSLTKTFVAVLVMRLRDDGLLKLSDPLEKHLSGTSVGAATILQLLTHSSGLASETPGPWWERTPGSLRPLLEDILGHSPMKHPHGRRFHYSNPGYAILGLLVEKLRNKPWGEVLQDEVLNPLEMTRTSLLPAAPYATGWAVHPWADVLLPEAVYDVGTMAPAGQLWSTVEDLGRFASLLMNGDNDVLSAETVAEMRTPHAVLDDGARSVSYGLGMQTRRVGERVLAGHTGSMPGFLCALWVCPEQHLSAATLANSTSGVAIGSLAADLIEIVVNREPRIPLAWKPLDDFDASLLEITGTWYWGPSPYALRLQRRSQLVLSSLSGSSSRDARFQQQSDGTWCGRNGYFEGETLELVRHEETGAIVHLNIASFIFTREPYEPEAGIPGEVDAAGWRGIS